MKNTVSSLVSKIREFLPDVDKEITENTRISELYLDSLLIFELLSELEQTYGIEITMDATTVEALLDKPLKELAKDIENLSKEAAHA